MIFMQYFPKGALACSEIEKPSIFAPLCEQHAQNDAEDLFVPVLRSFSLQRLCL